MTNPNLIAAIVPAALFGTAFVWLGIYYAHRFIHRHCHRALRWLHILNSHGREREDYGRERGHARRPIDISTVPRPRRHLHYRDIGLRARRRGRAVDVSPRERLERRMRSRMRERMRTWNLYRGRGVPGVVAGRRQRGHSPNRLHLRPGRVVGHPRGFHFRRGRIGRTPLGYHFRPGKGGARPSAFVYEPRRFEEGGMGWGSGLDVGAGHAVMLDGRTVIPGGPTVMPGATRAGWDRMAEPVPDISPQTRPLSPVPNFGMPPMSPMMPGMARGGFPVQAPMNPPWGSPVGSTPMAQGAPPGIVPRMPAEPPMERSSPIQHSTAPGMPHSSAHPAPVQGTTGTPPRAAFASSQVASVTEDSGMEGSLVGIEELSSPPQVERVPQGPTSGKADFIHICDEYPPIILERLRKQKQATSDSLSDTDTDTDTDSDSSTTEEISRIEIPGLAPRTTFQFPRYPKLPTRLQRPAPTSYPRQWMGGRGPQEPEPLRYAPKARMSGRPKLRNADERYRAPTKDPPRRGIRTNSFDIPKPPMGPHWSPQHGSARNRPGHSPHAAYFETRMPSPSVDREEHKESIGVFPSAGVEPTGEERSIGQVPGNGKAQNAEQPLPSQGPEPEHNISVKKGPPIPIPLRWDPLMRRSPRPYASSNDHDHVSQRGEGVPEPSKADPVENTKLKPEKQPILLGTAPPDVPSIKVGTEPGPEVESPYTPDNPDRNPSQEESEKIVSPSTFISSLHISDSAQNGGSGIEPDAGVGGDGAGKNDGIGAMVGADRDLNAEAIAQAGQSDILSSLNWD